MTISVLGINTKQIFAGEIIENKKLEPLKVIEKHLGLPAAKIFKMIEKGNKDKWIKALGI